MKNSSTALAAIIALGSISFVGCEPDREVNFRDTQIQELDRVNKDLENQLQACIDKKTVSYITEHPNQVPIDTARGVIDNATINERPTDLVISIENNILFKPGSAELSTRARTTLLQVVALLKNKYADGYYVRVDGHTDDQRISRSKDNWDDNWDLSGGRGQAVLHYLIDHGIPARELGFAGYGMERPLEPNVSAASRAHNRRVEIVVIQKIGDNGVPAPQEDISPHHNAHHVHHKSHAATSGSESEPDSSK